MGVHWCGNGCVIVPVRLPGLRWKLPNYMNIEDFAQITFSVSKLHSIAQNLLVHILSNTC